MRVEAYIHTMSFLTAVLLSALIIISETMNDSPADKSFLCILSQASFIYYIFINRN